MNEIIVTVITTAGLLGTAWIGRSAAQRVVKRRRAKRTEVAATVTEAARQEQDEAALADYENNPGAFIARVLDDNKQKHEELANLTTRLGEAEKGLEALRGEIKSLREEDTRFRSALIRWLRDVFWQWGKASDIPRPSPDDAIILRPVLPWPTHTD